MRLIPGSTAGEGVAGPVARRVMAATAGDPSLYVVSSPRRKVGKGADLRPIGVNQFHGVPGGPPSRYKNH